MKRVVLLKAGSVNPQVKLAHGDYDRWFLRAMSGSCQLVMIEAALGQALPPALGFDAVIITGSPASVTAPEPWMDRAAEYLVGAAEHRRPVLGVCFGHQLLGRAFGARVARCPNGREIGTVSVRLTEAGRSDPLFAGLPDELFVQATHEDGIQGMPEGATALAENGHTPLQALAFGPRIRSVQFHPELDDAAMATLIDARRERLEAESRLPPGERTTRLLAGVRRTLHAERVLTNFIEHF
jgi:GMP synthase (glutamine-hydrolysing)